MQSIRPSGAVAQRSIGTWSVSELGVGLGYGFSTVYLLAGLAQIGGGRGRAANS